MPDVPQTKLFSVDMPKGSLCDCGASAETQFVIAIGKGEAKGLAAEAKKLRELGQKAPNVCCGICIANQISQRGLFVAEVLKHHPVKWERVTCDCICLDCGKELSYGTFAHFHADTKQAICGDCGVNKRGWSDSVIAALQIKKAEISSDVQNLRKRYKIEVEGLYCLEEKISLIQLAESYNELEKRIIGAMSLLESYLNQVATGKEAEILKKLEIEIQDLQRLALEVSNEIRTRLFILDKAARDHKMAMRIFQTADAEAEEELAKLRASEGGNSEVPA